MKYLKTKQILFSVITFFTCVIMFSIAGCYLNDGSTEDYFGDEVFVSYNVDFCKKECRQKYKGPENKAKRIARC